MDFYYLSLSLFLIMLQVNGTSALILRFRLQGTSSFHDAPIVCDETLYHILGFLTRLLLGFIPHVPADNIWLELIRIIQTLTMIWIGADRTWIFALLADLEHRMIEAPPRFAKLFYVFGSLSFRYIVFEYWIILTKGRSLQGWYKATSWVVFA